MIIIFSAAYDLSTYDVQKWLEYLGYDEVVRVNNHYEYLPATFELYFDGETFRFQTEEGSSYRYEDIRAVWFRKGKDWLADQFFKIDLTDHPRLGAYLNQKVSAEKIKLAEYIQYLITTSKPTLGNPFAHDLNKLVVLKKAAEVGLKIPKFAITNAKKSLSDLVEKEGGLITKALSDGVYFFEKHDKETGYFSYTEEVDKHMLNRIPERIAPSLVQETIQKDFEVRVFYLEGKFYAMAIFSQSDEQTRIDFRKYLGKKPNRTVPYKLPSDIEDKLKHLMDRLDLNTGSVDLLVSPKGEHIFLEINPVGQFGMVSYPCNNYLEKKVAETLINHAKRTR